MSWFALLFLPLVIVGCSNAVNLTDGLDGLASGCTVTTAITYSLLTYVAGHQVAAGYLRIPYHPYAGEVAIFCAALVGSALGFLWFNCHPAKVFMGDTGALVIGFLISIFAIRFVEFNARLTEGTFLKFNSGITLAISVLIIPIFDTLRIIAVRLIKGRSPFAPDKNHTHHMLLRLGFSHAQSTIFLVVLNLAFIVLAVSLDFLGDNILMPIIISVAVAASLLLKYLVKRKVSKLIFAGKESSLEVVKSSRKAS
jgi:UDP-N-acetylmuramyl pentapeptide phosphotransferase/UDP-N-acetylglucosamine-1-phosphate transferase